MSVRMALGSLIIQNMVNLSDRKLVEMISENPYMQYFIGLSASQKSIRLILPFLCVLEKG